MTVARTAVRALAVSLGLLSCRGHAPAEQQAAPSAEASVRAAPVDHLAPGELPPGTEEAYGLTLPKGLRLVAHFPRVAHARGELSTEDVANYVRDRVDVKRVELGAVGTVFPSVHVKGGDPEKVLRIEVNPAGQGTELVIRDVTPVPSLPKDPNLSNRERWRRAGYNPDGTPLDPLQLR